MTEHPREIHLSTWLLEIIVPMAVYWVAQRLGLPVLVGLIAGAAFPLFHTAGTYIRRRRLDRVGALVLVEIAVSIALLLYLRDPRLLLIKPSFYSGAAAFYMMGNAFTAAPFSLEASRPMATKGDPARTAAWERAWVEAPAFRRAHRMLTFGWGLACLTDAVLRVVVVYRFPISRAVWLSNLPHIAAIAVMLGVSAGFGRWSGKLVDGLQHQLPPATAARC